MKRLTILVLVGAGCSAGAGRSIEMAEDAVARGHELYLDGELKSARASYQKAVKLDSANADGWMGLGYTYKAWGTELFIAGQGQKALGHFNEAITFFRTASRIGNEEEGRKMMALTHISIGGALERMGMDGEAQEEYQVAATLFKSQRQGSSDAAKYLFETACLYAVMENAEMASEYLAQAMDIDPEIGEQAKTDTRFDVVRDENCFRELLGYGELPKDEYFYSRGTNQYEQGKYREAIATFQEALRVKPDMYEAWFAMGFVRYYMGVLYEKSGDADSAREQYLIASDNFETGIRHNHTDHEAWNNLGYLRFKGGAYSEAIDAFNQSLELNPEYDVALFNLACTYGALKDPKRAIEYLGEAIEMEPMYRTLAREDPRFDPVKGEKAFKELVAR